MSANFSAAVDTADTSPFCASIPRPSLVTLVNDCHWLVGNDSEHRLLSSWWRILKTVQCCLSLAIGLGDGATAVIYWRLARMRRQKGRASGTAEACGLQLLLVLALFEAGHQGAAAVNRADALLGAVTAADAGMGSGHSPATAGAGGGEHGGVAYMQVSSLTGCLVWTYVSRLAELAETALYAARNFWVMAVVWNRCCVLWKPRTPGGGGARLAPYAIAVASLLLWAGAAVGWRLAFVRFVLIACDRGQQLVMVTRLGMENSTGGVNASYHRYSPVNGSENFIQVTRSLDICLPAGGSRYLLHLVYYQLAVHLPLLVIIVSCAITWRRIRHHSLRGRQRAARRQLVIIAASFAALECPTLIVQLTHEFQEMRLRGSLSDDPLSVRPPAQLLPGTGTGIAEVAESLSSLHSLVILAFYLLADAKFRASARRVILKCRRRGRRRSSGRRLSVGETWHRSSCRGVGGGGGGAGGEVGGTGGAEIGSCSSGSRSAGGLEYSVLVTSGVGRDASTSVVVTEVTVELCSTVATSSAAGPDALPFVAVEQSI